MESTVQDLHQSENDAPEPRQTALALPATVEELIAQRRSDKVKTLNDSVDDLFVLAYSDKEFRRLIDATDNSDACEGSLIADDFAAAGLIRKLATEKGNFLVAQKNLTTVCKAMRVVMRRYGLGRKERANFVSGRSV